MTGEEGEDSTRRSFSPVSRAGLFRRSGGPYTQDSDFDDIGVDVVRV